MSGNLAVFDLGKTNSKLFVFAPDGTIIDETRTRPRWLESKGLKILDDAHLEDWMREVLADAVRNHGVSAMMVSGHGCTFALVGETGLVHPILDYEQEPPAGIAASIDAQIPDFAETFSPRLPLGFNFGRHMLWLAAAEPRAFEKARFILGYPQYWSWRFSSRAASEVSYLGCHSHLWAPLKNDYSSLVDEKGWRGKMPERVRAGAVLDTVEVAGKAVAVHNGVHDSNAALQCYAAAGYDDFTLVSTGTWVIVFNTAAPLETLDEARDMLANVRVDGTPVATIRFMGGREFDTLRAGEPPVVDDGAIEAVLASGTMALPSFAEGGPFPGCAGQITGEVRGSGERAALALLYVALMTDLSLDLIASANTIIVDGGLSKVPGFLSMLAQLRPEQTVLASDNPEGSARGAAMLAFEAIGIQLPPIGCQSVRPAAFERLQAYKRRWRDAIASRETQPEILLRRARQ